MPDGKVGGQSKLLYGDLSYILTGILFESHNSLGRFAREKQYGNYIENRLKSSGIQYKRELIIGSSNNIADFVIDDKMVLELKNKPFLMDCDYSQIKRYLHETNLKLGILVNFREKTLRIRRVLNLDQNL